MQISLSLPPIEDVTVLRDYTPKELSEFNGKDSPKIYLAVNGKVVKSTYGEGSYSSSYLVLR